MTEPRFLIDESTDVRVVEPLQAAGIDVVTVHGEERSGMSDENVVALARDQERAIVTEDADFLRLHKDGTEHMGIIFLTTPLPVGKGIRQLKQVWTLYTKEALVGEVIFLPL